MPAGQQRKASAAGRIKAGQGGQSAGAGAPPRTLRSNAVKPDPDASKADTSPAASGKSPTTGAERHAVNARHKRGGVSQGRDTDASHSADGGSALDSESDDEPLFQAAARAPASSRGGQAGSPTDELPFRSVRSSGGSDPPSGSTSAPAAAAPAAAPASASAPQKATTSRPRPRAAIFAAPVRLAAAAKVSRRPTRSTKATTRDVEMIDAGSSSATSSSISSSDGGDPAPRQSKPPAGAAPRTLRSGAAKTDHPSAAAAVAASAKVPPARSGSTIGADKAAAPAKTRSAAGERPATMAAAAPVVSAPTRGRMAAAQAAAKVVAASKGTAPAAKASESPDEDAAGSGPGSGPASDAERQSAQNSSGDNTSSSSSSSPPTDSDDEAVVVGGATEAWRRGRGGGSGGGGGRGRGRGRGSLGGRGKRPLMEDLEPEPGPDEPPEPDNVDVVIERSGGPPVTVPGAAFGDIVAAYHVLRAFSFQLRLSPFSLQELCVAMCVGPGHSVLLDEVYLCVLKTLAVNEVAAERRLRKLNLELLDQVTWSEFVWEWLETWNGRKLFKARLQPMEPRPPLPPIVFDDAADAAAPFSSLHLARNLSGQPAVSEPPILRRDSSGAATSAGSMPHYTYKVPPQLPSCGPNGQALPPRPPAFAVLRWGKAGRPPVSFYATKAQAEAAHAVQVSTYTEALAHAYSIAPAAAATLVGSGQQPSCLLQGSSKRSSPGVLDVLASLGVGAELASALGVSLPQRGSDGATEEPASGSVERPGGSGQRDSKAADVAALAPGADVPMAEPMAVDERPGTSSAVAAAAAGAVARPASGADMDARVAGLGDQAGSDASDAGTSAARETSAGTSAAGTSAAAAAAMTSTMAAGLSAAGSSAAGAIAAGAGNSDTPAAMPAVSTVGEGDKDISAHAVPTVAGTNAETSLAAAAAAEAAAAPSVVAGVSEDVMMTDAPSRADGRVVGDAGTSTQTAASQGGAATAPHQADGGDATVRVSTAAAPPSETVARADDAPPPTGATAASSARNGKASISLLSWLMHSKSPGTGLPAAVPASATDELAAAGGDLAEGSAGLAAAATGVNVGGDGHPTAGSNDDSGKGRLEATRGATEEAPVETSSAGRGSSKGITATAHENPSVLPPLPKEQRLRRSSRLPKHPNVTDGDAAGTSAAAGGPSAEGSLSHRHRAARAVPPQRLRLPGRGSEDDDEGGTEPRPLSRRAAAAAAAAFYHHRELPDSAPLLEGHVGDALQTPNPSRPDFAVDLKPVEGAEGRKPGGVPYTLRGLKYRLQFARPLRRRRLTEAATWSVVEHAAILAHLCNDLLEAPPVRQEMDRREAQGQYVAGHGGEGGAWAMRTPEERAARAKRLASGHAEDGNSTICVLCTAGGNLVCCDGCCAAYHLRCINETARSIPDGEWLCHECRLGGRGEAAGLRVQPSGVTPFGSVGWAAYNTLFLGYRKGAVGYGIESRELPGPVPMALLAGEQAASRLVALRKPKRRADEEPRASSVATLADGPASGCCAVAPPSEAYLNWYRPSWLQYTTLFKSVVEAEMRRARRLGTMGEVPVPLPLSRFAWPSQGKGQKTFSRCGQCLHCRRPSLRKACLKPNVRAADGNDGAAGGMSKLTCIQNYLLKAERDLAGLLEGAWTPDAAGGTAHEARRQQWIARVKAAKTASCVALQFVVLEAAVRRTLPVFNNRWEPTQARLKPPPAPAAPPATAHTSAFPAHLYVAHRSGASDTAARALNRAALASGGGVLLQPSPGTAAASPLGSADATPSHLIVRRSGTGGLGASDLRPLIASAGVSGGLPPRPKPPLSSGPPRLKPFSSAPSGSDGAGTTRLLMMKGRGGGRSGAGRGSVGRGGAVATLGAGRGGVAMVSRGGGAIGGRGVRGRGGGGRRGMGRGRHGAVAHAAQPSGSLSDVVMMDVPSASTGVAASGVQPAQAQDDGVKVEPSSDDGGLRQMDVDSSGVDEPAVQAAEEAAPLESQVPEEEVQGSQSTVAVQESQVAAEVPQSQPAAEVQDSQTALEEAQQPPIDGAAEMECDATATADADVAVDGGGADVPASQAPVAPVEAIPEVAVGPAEASSVGVASPTAPADEDAQPAVPAAGDDVAGELDTREDPTAGVLAGGRDKADHPGALKRPAEVDLEDVDLQLDVEPTAEEVAATPAGTQSQTPEVGRRKSARAAASAAAAAAGGSGGGAGTSQRPVRLASAKRVKYADGHESSGGEAEPAERPAGSDGEDGWGDDDQDAGAVDLVGGAVSALGPFFWYRSPLARARAVLQLPRAMTHTLARRAGSTSLLKQGVQYRQDGEHKIMQRLRWIATCEATTSVAQLGIQVRLFDEAVNWERLKRPVRAAMGQFSTASVLARRAALPPQPERTAQPSQPDRAAQHQQPAIKHEDGLALQPTPPSIPAVATPYPRDDRPLALGYSNTRVDAVGVAAAATEAAPPPTAVAPAGADPQLPVLSDAPSAAVTDGGTPEVIAGPSGNMPIDAAAAAKHEVKAHAAEASAASGPAAVARPEADAVVATPAAASTAPTAEEAEAAAREARAWSKALQGTYDYLVSFDSSSGRQPSGSGDVWLGSTPDATSPPGAATEWLHESRLPLWLIKSYEDEARKPEEPGAAAARAAPTSGGAGGASREGGGRSGGSARIAAAAARQQSEENTCSVCSGLYGKEDVRRGVLWIACDHCDRWFHGRCVDVDVGAMGNKDKWQCRECRDGRVPLRRKLSIKRRDKGSGDLDSPPQRPPRPTRAPRDGEPLYCLCHQPWDESVEMVGCDGCDNWYHPACVGATAESIAAGETWFCSPCTALAKREALHAVKQAQQETGVELFDHTNLRLRPKLGDDGKPIFFMPNKKTGRPPAKPDQTRGPEDGRSFSLISRIRDDDDVIDPLDKIRQAAASLSRQDKGKTLAGQSIVSGSSGRSQPSNVWRPPEDAPPPPPEGGGGGAGGVGGGGATDAHSQLLRKMLERAGMNMREMESIKAQQQSPFDVPSSSMSGMPDTRFDAMSADEFEAGGGTAGGTGGSGQQQAVRFMHGGSGSADRGIITTGHAPGRPGSRGDGDRPSSDPMAASHGPVLAPLLRPFVPLGSGSAVRLEKLSAGPRQFEVAFGRNKQRSGLSGPLKHQPVEPPPPLTRDDGSRPSATGSIGQAEPTTGASAHGPRPTSQALPPAPKRSRLAVASAVASAVHDVGSTAAANSGGSAVVAATAGGGAAAEGGRWPPADWAARAASALQQLCHDKVSTLFRAPVAKDMPDYYKEIQFPMDLGTVSRYLASGDHYETPDDVAADVALIWSNCLTYNEGDEVAKSATVAAQTTFDRLWRVAGLVPPAEPQPAVAPSRPPAVPPPSRSIPPPSSGSGTSAAAAPAAAVPAPPPAAPAEWRSLALRVLESVMALPEARGLLRSSTLRNYLAAVREPMDLTTVHEGLAQGKAASWDQVLRQLYIMWANCFFWWRPELQGSKDGRASLEAFGRLCASAGLPTYAPDVPLAALYNTDRPPEISPLLAGVFKSQPHQTHAQRMNSPSQQQAVAHPKPQFQPKPQPKAPARPQAGQAQRASGAAAAAAAAQPPSAARPVAMWERKASSVLRLLLRADAAAPFADPMPVTKYPDYTAVVASPMDLGTVAKRLQQGGYSSWQQVLAHVNLVWSNCRQYGAKGAIPVATMVDAIDELAAHFSDLCWLAELPPPGDQGARGSSHAAVPSPSQAAGPSGTTDGRGLKRSREGDDSDDHEARGGSPDYGAGKSAVGVGSTSAGGTRDLQPSSAGTALHDAGPNRRDPWQSVARAVLLELMDDKMSVPFLYPVTEEVAPEYFDVVKHPMDLSTMASKLHKGAYPDADAFAGDGWLMFRNCELYNRKSSRMAKIGRDCRARFEQLCLKSGLLASLPAAVPPAVAPAVPPAAIMLKPSAATHSGAHQSPGPSTHISSPPPSAALRPATTPVGSTPVPITLLAQVAQRSHKKARLSAPPPPPGPGSNGDVRPAAAAATSARRATDMETGGSRAAPGGSVKAGAIGAVVGTSSQAGRSSPARPFSPANKAAPLAVGGTAGGTTAAHGPARGSPARPAGLASKPAVPSSPARPATGGGAHRPASPMPSRLAAGPAGRGVPPAARPASPANRSAVPPPLPGRLLRSHPPGQVPSQQQHRKESGLGLSGAVAPGGPSSSRADSGRSANSGGTSSQGVSKGRAAGQPAPAPRLTRQSAAAAPKQQGQGTAK